VPSDRWRGAHGSGIGYLWLFVVDRRKSSLLYASTPPQEISSSMHLEISGRDVKRSLVLFSCYLLCSVTCTEIWERDGDLNASLELVILECSLSVRWVVPAPPC
jgi:hypothetical protein